MLFNPQPHHRLASTAARIRSDCRQQRRRTLQQGASTTVRCLHCRRCASGWALVSSSCSCWSCCSAAAYRACTSAQRRQQRTQTRRRPGGGGRCCINTQHGEGRGRGGIGWGTAESQHRGFCITRGGGGQVNFASPDAQCVGVVLQHRRPLCVLLPHAPSHPTIFLLTRPPACPHHPCAVCCHRCLLRQAATSPAAAAAATGAADDPDGWRARMQQQYGLDTSQFTYRPGADGAAGGGPGSRDQQGERGRGCSIM